jgi:hypothetical protein
MCCKAYFVIVSVLKMDTEIKLIYDKNTYEELTIIYKNKKPEYAMYAGELSIFFKQNISKGKIGFVAETEAGETIVVGAPGCAATFKGDFMTQWIQTKHEIGSINKDLEMYLFEKKIKVSTK